MWVFIFGVDYADLILIFGVKGNATSAYEFMFLILMVTFLQGMCKIFNILSLISFVIIRKSLALWTLRSNWVILIILFDSHTNSIFAVKNRIHVQA